MNVLENFNYKDLLLREGLVISDWGAEGVPSEGVQGGGGVWSASGGGS